MNINKLFFGLGLILLLGIFLIQQNEILIESEQSKTKSDGPVFNKIKFFQLPGKDIWMMNQSHFGVNAEFQNWDWLAIVVDTTKYPKEARFYQFDPGPLEWSDSLKERPFRVSCYMCHSSGPRAIRPLFDSSDASINLTSKLQIMGWNLRIKAYGPIVPASRHEKLDQKLAIPFRWPSTFENEKLEIETCVKCHNGKGILGRNFLTRQNLQSIQFMLEKGYMPPFGFEMSTEERVKLQRFIRGF